MQAGRLDFWDSATVWLLYSSGGLDPRLDVPNWDSPGWVGRSVDWPAVGWGRGDSCSEQCMKSQVARTILVT